MAVVCTSGPDWPHLRRDWLLVAACGNFAGFGAKTGALTERYLGPQTALRELREEVLFADSISACCPATVARVLLSAVLVKLLSTHSCSYGQVRSAPS